MLLYKATMPLTGRTILRFTWLLALHAPASAARLTQLQQDC